MFWCFVYFCLWWLWVFRLLLVLFRDGRLLRGSIWFRRCFGLVFFSLVWMRMILSMCVYGLFFVVILFVIGCWILMFMDFVVKLIYEIKCLLRCKIYFIDKIIVFKFMYFWKLWLNEIFDSWCIWILMEEWNLNIFKILFFDMIFFIF